MSHAKQRKVAIMGILILILILPVAIYQLFFGRVPTVTASEAIQQLESVAANVILVDVRDASSYQREHVDGAVHFPLTTVRQIRSASDLPESWRAKSFFVISSAGFKSRAAGQHLLAIGVSDVHNVRGGMQEWAKAGVENPDSRFSHFITQNKAPYQMTQTMSMLEQSLQLLTGFVIKPAHMILSVLIIWILLGNKSPEITLVKWALVALLVGEAFCALNFIFFHEDSLLAEHIHNAGMIMSFTLVGWAAIVGLDSRIIKLGAQDKPCAIVNLCGRCDKVMGGTCKGRQLFKWMLLAGIIITFLPLTIEPGYGGISGWIFESPYFYSELYIFQLFEARYLPLVALFFFAISWFTLRIDKAEPIPGMAILFAAAGLGSLGFAVFRLGLHFLYEQQVLWFSFWEEATELLFVTLVAVVLWVFRQRLLGAGWSLSGQFHRRRSSRIGRNPNPTY